jgi:hypothetical protein
MPLDELKGRSEMAHGFAAQASRAAIAIEPPPPLRCPR